MLKENRIRRRNNRKAKREFQDWIRMEEDFNSMEDYMIDDIVSPLSSRGSAKKRTEALWDRYIFRGINIGFNNMEEEYKKEQNGIL